MRFPGLFLLAMLAAQPAWAKMYKWVDEKGSTHYGDSIPAQYAGQGKSELNPRGLVIRKTAPALTPEQRKESEDAAVQKKAEAQQKLEQSRKDQALLDTYTSEQEIDLTRDRNLQQEDVVIQTLRLQIKSAQKKLDKHKKQAAAMAQARKPVPPDLADDIREAEQEIARQEARSEQKRQDIAAVRANFEVAKARFRELKQGSQPARQ
jgi:hypothetical protein